MPVVRDPLSHRWPINKGDGNWPSREKTPARFIRDFHSASCLSPLFDVFFLKNALSNSTLPPPTPRLLLSSISIHRLARSCGDTHTHTHEMLEMERKGERKREGSSCCAGRRHLGRRRLRGRKRRRKRVLCISVASLRPRPSLSPAKLVRKLDFECDFKSYLVCRTKYGHEQRPVIDELSPTII